RGRLVDQEIFPLGAGLDRGCEPARLCTASRPGIPLAVAILRRDLSALERAASPPAAIADIVATGESRELALELIGLTAEHDYDVVAQLEQRINRHQREIGRSGHR